MDNVILSAVATLGPVMAMVGAIIIGLMQITKAFKIGKVYLPLFALAYGMILTSMFIGFSSTSIVVGMVTGLSAMGLFSGSKTMVKN